MEKYYFNKYKIKKNDCVIVEANEPKIIVDNYASGIKIDLKEVKPKYYFESKDAEKLDLIPGGQLALVTSSKFKSLFDQNDIQEVEFHPITLICEQDGSDDNSYYFLNILNNVPCLDKQKSDFNLFHPDYDIIGRVNKLVLDQKIIGNRKIFRIAEFPTLVIYSDDLRCKIESAELTGFNFVNIEKYRPI